MGSGRVGRTRTLALSKRAELAARAYIRHKHTNYEADLWSASGESPMIDPDPRDPLYPGIKAEAQKAVDRFLAEHRA